jgi:hypothetical protein
MVQKAFVAQRSADRNRRRLRRDHTMRFPMRFPMRLPMRFPMRFPMHIVALSQQRKLRIRRIPGGICVRVERRGQITCMTANGMQVVLLDPRPTSATEALTCSWDGDVAVVLSFACCMHERWT